MAGHSIPIDIRVHPDRISNKELRLKLLDDFKMLVMKCCGSLNLVSSNDLPKNFVYLFCNENGTTLHVKMYEQGLVSSVLEFYTTDIHTQTIGVDEAMKLESELKEKCGADMAKVLPAIKRAPPINPYFTSSDDRLLEYDVDEVLFHEVTPYQKVEIIHTKSFGNILVLDNLQNLAESDISYTHGLMNKGKDSYEGKEVLILGGGDGALMKELLEENPKFVTMIDIDEAVMRSCQKYLRDACGTALDSFKGENYETIVGDALVYMDEYIKKGKLFDYVFMDLTDVPVSPEPVGDLWDFLGSVMTMGTKLLKPSTGRYMTHAIGVQCTDALKNFEKKLNTLEIGAVSVTRTEHYVPSFMEKWTFFQVTRGPLQTS